MIQETKIKISTPIGLQIDNLVYNKHGEIHPIRANDFSRFNHPDMGGDYGLYAIPLTPSILEKCGFIQHHDDCYNDVLILEHIFNQPPFQYKIFPQELGGAEEPKNSCKIYSLHQLQNIYHALTQTELKIQL